MSQPIVIWGAGAIGGTLGAAFMRAGEEVIFVDTAKDHVDAINADGLSSRARSRRKPACQVNSTGNTSGSTFA